MEKASLVSGELFFYLLYRENIFEFESIYFKSVINVS